MQLVLSKKIKQLKLLRLLNTDFEGGRHQIRVEKIHDLK